MPTGVYEYFPFDIGSLTYAQQQRRHVANLVHVAQEVVTCQEVSIHIFFADIFADVALFADIQSTDIQGCFTEM